MINQQQRLVMNEHASIPNNSLSFKEFLFKEKSNRSILIIAALAITIQFLIFKYLYPYASYIHGDSFSYLRAAYYNYDIDTYMVGYSRFLRLFSVFTKSDFVLTAFQYLFIQASSIFLLFSIFYFYNLGKAVQYVLLVFMVFNPLFLHLGNLISSDCVFASLSLIWFASLLWILNKPSILILVWQVVVLFFVFTVRYNALIYPFIAAGAILLSKLPLKRKMVAVGAGLLVCGLFVTYTSYQYKKLTGIWQYSPFSGWQFANNAMYAYRYIASAERKPVPQKYVELDKMIRQYFDSTRNLKKYPYEAVKASTYYMWSPGMPLMKYREKVFKKDTTAGDLKTWASMGPFYKEYGLYIIKRYPWQFAKYFIWPNSHKYYAPPVEFLQVYNGGKDSVPQLARTWFGYKNGKLWTRTKDPEVTVLNYYPILSGIINIVMLFGLIFYSLLNGFNRNNYLRSAIILGGTVWLLNAAFTISASSAALRFQSFPILISTIFSFLIIDWIRVMAISNIPIEKLAEENNALPAIVLPTVEL